MKIYITKGEHWYVGGVSIAAFATKAGAEARALELVEELVTDLDSEELEAFERPAEGGWAELLRAAQRARIVGKAGGLALMEDDALENLAMAMAGKHIPYHGDAHDYLAGNAEGAVWIETLDLADWTQPRVVITIDGGCVTDVTSDQPMEAIVIDLDVDGADDVHLIPQADGDFERGTFHRYATAVDAYEVDLRCKAQPVEEGNGCDYCGVIEGDHSKNCVNADEPCDLLAVWLAEHGGDEPDADKAWVNARFCHKGEMAAAGFLIGGPEFLRLARAEEALTAAYGDISKVIISLMPPRNLGGSASR